MDKESRLYFILIKFGGDQPIRQRIVECAHPIKTIIDDLSHRQCQLAFTSDDGGSMGFVVETALVARQIRLRLLSPEVTDGSPIRRSDSLLTIEIGKDFDGVGFSKAWNWIDHHSRPDRAIR